MKIDRLSKQSIAPFKNRHPSPQDQKETQAEKTKEREQLFDIAAQFRDLKIQEKNAAADSIRALHELLERAIEWRELRFYHHAKDGTDYVDIIDRVSGEVIKTIPEPDFVKLANSFKQHPGITLDITG